MIQRVANQLRHRLCPHLELLTVWLITGNVFLWNTVHTHLSPLVVVTDRWLSKPYLINIIVLLVRSDILRINMAVVIKNRRLLCDVVIELLRYICAEQEVLVHKWFHSFTSMK